MSATSKLSGSVTEYSVLPCWLGKTAGPPILVQAATPRAAAETVFKQHFDGDSTIGPARALVSYVDQEGQTRHMIFRRSFAS